ncbi:MAG TPA: BlaI/MecI/CopY family transcriptional regulator [Pirellulaceae bacterium]|nr:BlaI/MecI/CopY family transcriptional regulator [Pirellulaceae bacterium]
MARRSLDRLGELQQAVMDIVWELGEATVSQVRERLDDNKKLLAYTTVLSVMQKLEKAGWLGHREKGRTYVYCPTRTREKSCTQTLRQFIDRIFAGDPLQMFQHLLDDDEFTADDLTALKKMIDQRRKDQRK